MSDVSCVNIAACVNQVVNTVVKMEVDEANDDDDDDDDEIPLVSDKIYCKSWSYFFRSFFL